MITVIMTDTEAAKSERLEAKIGRHRHLTRLATFIFLGWVLHPLVGGWPCAWRHSYSRPFHSTQLEFFQANGAERVAAAMRVWASWWRFCLARAAIEDFASAICKDLCDSQPNHSQKPRLRWRQIEKNGSWCHAHLSCHLGSPVPSS